MVVKNERKRYILVEFYRSPPSKRELINQLRNNIESLGGQLALAKASIHVIDVLDHFAIIRATTESRDLVESAIQLLDFDDNLVTIRVVSGTIAKINTLLNQEYRDEID